MPETPLLKIYYTNKAVADLIGIKGYILKFFTQKEVDRLYTTLQGVEKIVAAFPELYPTSIKNNKIHRAVLSKQISVFYKVSEDKISVIAILDNRMDYAKWP